jgi:hypothetical protein
MSQHASLFFPSNQTHRQIHRTAHAHINIPVANPNIQTVLTQRRNIIMQASSRSEYRSNSYKDTVPNHAHNQSGRIANSASSIIDEIKSTQKEKERYKFRPFFRFRAFDSGFESFGFRFRTRRRKELGKNQKVGTFKVRRGGAATQAGQPPRRIICHCRESPLEIRERTEKF